MDGQEGTTGLQINEFLSRRTDIELLRIERPGLVQHLLVDPELADVVDERRLRQAHRRVGLPAGRHGELLREQGHTLRVPFRPGLAGVELARERAQPLQAVPVLPAGREIGVELVRVAEGRVAAGRFRVQDGDLGEAEQLLRAPDLLEVADARRGRDRADARERRRRDGAARALGGDPAVQALRLRQQPGEVVGAEP